MIDIITVLAAIVILGIVVMIHEFGHYIVGRKAGIGVVEFAVGMGPKIFGWERNGTKYSVRAIPLGGYCAFVGEDENNQAPNAMNNQPVWKRFLTVLAGPFMNLLLAFVLAVAVLPTGIISNPEKPVLMLYSVEENMPAGKAGLLPGDILTHLDGTAIQPDDAGMEFMSSSIISAEENQEIRFTVKRNGESLVFSIVPVYDETAQRNYVGFSYGQSYEAYDVTFLQAIPASFRFMGSTVVQTVATLKDIVVDIFSGSGVQNEAVMGPVGIVSTVSTGIQFGFADAFSSGINMIVSFIMLISLSLGIMNLLPIPALDGGRLLFLIVEAIRRKPVNREREALVNIIGFAFLILLIIVITVSDVRGLFR